MVLTALNPEVARIARADLSLGSSDDYEYYSGAVETAERIPPTTAVELRIEHAASIIRACIGSPNATKKRN